MIAQVVCFSKMDVFGSDPDVLLLVVFSVGLLGGSLTGAVFGFSVGLLMDCLLLETLGGFALTLLSVGYVAGRYRETVGRPTRGAVPLLGGRADAARRPGDRGDPDRHRAWTPTSASWSCATRSSPA